MTSACEYRLISWDDRYRVGSDGTVWSRAKMGSGGGKVETWRKLKQWRHTQGYWLVGINKRPQYLHRIVAEAYHGPCPPGHQCCHNDGNKDNNSADNLRWDSANANASDKIRHGTHLAGDRAPCRKLNEFQVGVIVGLCVAGYSRRKVAEMFGIAPSSVDKIFWGRNWRAATEISKRE
jgi:hypothetical protein